MQCYGVSTVFAQVVGEVGTQVFEIELCLGIGVMAGDEFGETGATGDEDDAAGLIIHGDGCGLMTCQAGRVKWFPPNPLSSDRGGC